MKRILQILGACLAILLPVLASAPAQAIQAADPTPVVTSQAVQAPVTASQEVTPAPTAAPQIAPAPDISSVVPKPTPSFESRYIWAGCDDNNYSFKQIGEPNQQGLLRVIRQRACLKVYQVRQGAGWPWVNERLTAYGAVQCKIEVSPNPAYSLQHRFNTTGRGYPCSFNSTLVFVLNDGAADSEFFSDVISNANGFWSNYMYSTNVSAEWGYCDGRDIWASDHALSHVGLNSQRHYGYFDDATSYHFGC